MLELEILGPPRIRLNNEPVVDFISNKALLLLCYLALSPRVHARDTLAGLLWGHMSDKRAKANLRQALHNLQKLLPGYLAVTRATVAFDPGQSHWLDAALFCRTVDQPDIDIGRLEAAIGLYQGEFLEGQYIDDAPEFEDWLRGERERYRLLLLTGLNRLSQHHLCRGNWQQAASLTRRLLELEPWREASHRQLMLLLARQGQYNAALAHYQSCRKLLETELGVEPMAETVALYRRIKAARTTPRHNLPPGPGPFIGRRNELEQVEQWLCEPDCRLLTIVGPGGVGKTRLAQEAAGRCCEQFLNGVRYVPLAALTEPDFIVTALAEALALQFSGRTPARQQLLDHLAGQDLLLVLDNFEHLMGGVDLVEAILSAGPEVSVMVTSREPLQLREEWLFRLEGLRSPPAGLLDPAGLHQFDAVQFFGQQARRRQHDFDLAEQAQPVAQLCRVLAGSPLGLELAAGLLPEVSCGQMVTEIKQDLDVLTAIWRNTPARHRSLQAVFVHSWRLLPAEEQAVFSRLAVFGGNFSLEAAGQVANADRSALHRLAAKSLLRVVPGQEDSLPRYELHPLLRHYAAEVLDEKPDILAQVQAAHTIYYTQFLHRQEGLLTAGSLQVAIAAILPELDNIRQAWQTAVARRDLAALDRAIIALHKFYEGHNWFQEGNDLFDLALESLSPELLSGPEEQRLWGKLLAHSAGLRLRLGRVPKAHELARRSVAQLRPLDCPALLAFALNILGVTQQYTGEFEAARETLQACAQIYRRLDNRPELLKPLTNLGSVCVRMGDYEMARAVLEEGLTICHQVGDRRGLNHFLANLGGLHHAVGNFAVARQYYEQALQVSDKLNYLHVKGVTLVNLAEIDVRQGAYGLALSKCKEGVAVLRRIEDRRNLANGLKWLGLAYHGLQEELAAHQSLAEGLQTALDSQAEPVILSVLVGAAILLRDSGQIEAGLTLLTTIAGHPATEQGQRTHATALLAGLEDDCRGETKAQQSGRSLSEIARTVLLELRGDKPEPG